MATFSAAPERELRVIIGVMLEMIQKSKDSSTIWIDGLVMFIQRVDDDQPDDAFPEFRGVSAPVMALAAQRVVEVQKYKLEISEVLAAARAARLDFWRAWRATGRLIALRDDAEDVIAITSDDSAADPDHIPF